MSETIRTAPERIWLQVGDQSHYHSEPFPRDTGEVTWCADSVAGCEVPYVRADLATVVPEGWQLVPVEPTDAMCYDGRQAGSTAYADPDGIAIVDLWEAMLAAAPKPEAAQ